MFPKRKQNVVAIPLPIGRERVAELMAGTDLKTTYLPKNITLEDIDNSLFEKFNTHFQITIDGKVVPYFFMTNERWGEFEKTWEFQDNDKNVLTPFITIKRIGSPEKGSIWGEIYTYAQRRTFKYIDVPTLEDEFIIFTKYKIPQAAPVNLEYEISMFSKYQLDENEFDQIMIRKFASRQEYCTFNGNYFPIITDSYANNDEVDDVNGERLYISTYTVKLMGYLQDESEFQITKTTKFARVNYNI